MPRQYIRLVPHIKPTLAERQEEMKARYQAKPSPTKGKPDQPKSKPKPSQIPALYKRSLATYGFGETRVAVFTRMGYQPARALIQKGARHGYLRSGRPMCCFFCGYDHHIDIAHRRGVMDFPETTLIDEINDPGNLIALCPNHHREADSGEIDLIAAKSLEGPLGNYGFLRPPHSQKRFSGRRRQKGSLGLKERRNGPSMWVLRYTDNGAYRSILIGNQDQLPTRELAQSAAESMRRTMKKHFAHVFEG